MSIAARRLQRGRPGTAPTGPLVVSNVQSSVSGGQLTVTWQTNLPADSRAALYFGPAKHCSWNWQLSGTLDTSADAQVYDIDGFETTAAQVAALHAQNRYCIAYFGGGDWENYRTDAAAFPPEVLGNAIDGWPEEKWLDVRALSVIEPIMAARAEIAKSKGFDGIEWDCVDNYEQDSGFSLTQADQFAYNTMLARLCHERGLACFLKNCVTDVDAYQPFYEGNVVEEAYRYNEQVEYRSFALANKPVLVCEYRAQDVVQANQDDANANGLSLIYHKLALNSKYLASYVVSPAPAVTLTGTQSPKLNATPTTSHSMTFTGLTAGQAYGFLVWSRAGSQTVYDTTPRRVVAA